MDAGGRRRLVRSGVFGAVDGLGLAIGLLLVVGSRAVLLAAAANAAAEFAGMTSGEWLTNRGEALRAPAALANGAGAAVYAFAPVLAFRLAGVPAAVAVLVSSVILLAWVMPSEPWWRSWAETFATVAAVSAVTAAVAAVAG